MTWPRQATAPKYRSKAHRLTREYWALYLARVGQVDCAQPVCLMPTRTIRNGERWHLGHSDDGLSYIGPVHPRCNREAGAQKAIAVRRAKARGQRAVAPAARPAPARRRVCSCGDATCPGRWHL